MSIRLSLAAVLLLAAPAAADPLPNTKPLTETGDLARKMVDGIHVYLDRELAAAPAKRDRVKPDRERLRKILGVVDRRELPRLELVSPATGPASEGRFHGIAIRRVRWAVLPGVWAEGVYYQSGKPKPVGLVVLTDDPLNSSPGENLTAALLAGDGCDVLVPTLLDRADTLSANPKLNRATNQPHREFVHRMAFEMGRTLVGYEVQQVLAAVDWFHRDGKPAVPVGVFGRGDGGRAALYAAALDDRVGVCLVSGAFGPQESGWQRPLDRNLFGVLTAFGDAELAALISPRQVIIDPDPGPTWAGPTSRPGRTGAAPGDLAPVAAADVAREVGRAKKRAAVLTPMGRPGTLSLVSAFGVKREPTEMEKAGTVRTKGTTFTNAFDDPPAVVQKRQFDQLVAYTQKLWRDSDAVRREFWKKADASSPEAWEKSCEWYRTYFHEEVIGKLPEPTMPLNPRSRQVYDTPKWTGHEVALDVYPDVIASGILLLPKDLKPGEKRPVVVCQHGLEGRPTDVCDPTKRTKYYNSFGAQLADRGYIVYAPQNPYIFENHFRQLQRKANPLKLALFSFIIRQHQRTLDWLETLPNVDPKRIAFYGLSYGGKTAMRVPAVEKRYCLSICSGDFNEWVGKNVSVDLDRSYMWTREYEMYEFDLGNTFNYAEMAYLIAPRPFMVERGHDDGVGTDEMVAWEYAKVRYLYANKLKRPDRTAIEFFPGGHEIHGQGTFAFLKKHLGWPR